MLSGLTYYKPLKVFILPNKYCNNLALSPANKTLKRLLSGMEKLDAAINGSFREREFVGLHALSREVSNIDAAVAQIARYSAELTLPQGTIHVLSDIHSEDQKLRILDEPHRCAWISCDDPLVYCSFECSLKHALHSEIDRGRSPAFRARRNTFHRPGSSLTSSTSWCWPAKHSMRRAAS